MASITLTGTLLDPTGEVAVGDQIRFTHRTTTGETIQFARSVLIIPPNGLYNITLEFGLIFVEYLDVKDVHYKNLGVVTVNGDTTATDLPGLLNAIVPPTDAQLLLFQGILADTEDARDIALLAAAQQTTLELIASTTTHPNSTVLTLSGHTLPGDGGGGKWQLNGAVGQTPSQSPTQLADFLLNDGNGNQWALVDGVVLAFNGVQYLPLPFGANGNGNYAYNDNDFDKITDLINDLSQAYTFKTVELMQSSLIIFPVGKKIFWQGYYVESDGGSNWGIVKSGAHTDDGGSIFTLADGQFVEANLKGKKTNVRKFGAKIDSNFTATNNPTDDTLAVQACIDFVNKDGVVYTPKGFSMITQLVVSSGIDFRGDGGGITYYIQKSGETIPMFTDDGFPINLFVRDISFDMNFNTIPLAGVYIGHGDIQFGTVAGFNNVFIRNVIGVGANINGNVSINKYIEIHFCTTGIIINGSGNKYSNLITANCTEIGIQVLGTNNVINKTHHEGQSSIACIDIGPNVIGTVIDEVNILGSGANIHGAGVRLGLNSKLSRITNVRAIVDSFANITNGLIYDQSFAGGDLKLWGKDSGGIRFGVAEYNQGARAQMPFNDQSLPPTLGTFRKGDWFIGGSGDNGTPRGWTCDNNGTPGSWSPMETVAGAVSMSSSDTLDSDDLGKRFKNDTATGVISPVLPQVSEGSRIHFTRRNTFDYRIQPFAGDIIRPGGQNKYLSLDTDGASVTLEFMSNLSWCIVAQSGTISHEP